MDAAVMLGGAPSKVAEDLIGFAESAKTLSSRRERLLENHEKQWIGLHQGKVEVFGKTLKSVLSQLEEKGMSADDTIIRFIDKDIKTLIL